MRAIVQESYGSPDVLRLGEVDAPVVGDDDVLVRVRAASLHPDVWHMMVGRPYVLRVMGAGLRKPKKVVPGTDMSGIVEAAGKNVTRFRPGDAVFGETIKGYQWVNGGAFAEYASVNQDNLAKKPDNVTFEQAASVPTAGLIVLINFRNNALPKPGQRVLVNGAAGGVGSIALQFAKARGAHVTAVELTDKLDIARALGADQVIDGAQIDFTRGDERYDLVVDVPCNHPFSACRRVLTPTGVYVIIGHDHFGRAPRPILGLIPYALGLGLLSFFVKQLAKLDFTMPSKPDSMATLQELLASGKLTPIVDRTFSLDEVPVAMRYMQEGRARGRVIITI